MKKELEDAIEKLADIEPDFLNWHLISENSTNINLIKKNMNRIDKRKLSCNCAGNVDMIGAFIDKIDLDVVLSKAIYPFSFYEKYAEKLGFEYLFTHSQLPIDKLNHALLATDDDDFILIKVNTQHSAVKDFIVYIFCEMQNLQIDIIGYLDVEKIIYEFKIDHEIIYIGDNSYYVKINNYKKSASSLDWWKWKKWDYLINKCLKNVNGTIIE